MGYSSNRGGRTINLENQEIKKQLADIVDININDFGAVGDGITNNADAYLRLLNFINADGNKSYNIFFPKGAYYSTIQLELPAEKIILRANNAKLIKEIQDVNSAPDSLVVYAKNCKTFKCSGFEMENRIVDKSVVSTNTSGGRYYHIWVRSSVLTYCDIANNVFYDYVSIPNSPIKPYNGSIWIGDAKNIFIHNNKFYNSCGRVIYVSRSEDGEIYGNYMENISFIPTEITNINVGTLPIRVLSCKNIKIHDNNIRGTTVYNANHLPVQGITLSIAGIEETTYAPNEGIQVYNNTIMANETHLKAFYLEGCIKSVIHNNDVTLNNTNPSLLTSFITIPIISDINEQINVKVENNRIDNAHTSSIRLEFSETYMAQVHLTLKGNDFNSSNVLTGLIDSVNFNILDNCINLYDNKILQNNVYKAHLVERDQINYDILSYTGLTITSTNINTYLIGGVLNIPQDIKRVEFDTSGDLAVIINDIKFNNNYLNGREITLVHKAGNGTLTITHDVNLIRLPNSTNIVLPIFDSLKLIYLSNRWYKSI